MIKFWHAIETESFAGHIKSLNKTSYVNVEIIGKMIYLSNSFSILV